MSKIQLASSTRFILAMFRLIAAAFEDGVGRGVISILKKQYPDADIDANPSQVGNKLMNIVKKQVQGSETDAQDALQDFLRYLVESEFDFTKGSKTWREAINNIYSNARTKAISYSMSKMKKVKRTKGIDDAFGTRGDGGDAPSGGEGRIESPNEGLGARLDDRAAIKEFLDLIEDHLQDLRKTLTSDSRALFDLIFFDEEGSFSNDIKENMGQASKLKELNPDMFEKNKNRWSGFVGDLRKKLLSEIWNYIDNNLTQGEYNILKETFFGDTSPEYIRRKEKEKVSDKENYQQGIDERKIAKWKWQQENSTFSEKDKKSFDSLSKKLKSMGVDVDSIPATEDPDAKTWKIQPKNKKSRASSMFRELSIAVRVATSEDDWSF